MSLVANHLGPVRCAAHNRVRAGIAENQVRGAHRGGLLRRDQHAPQGVSIRSGRCQHTAGRLKKVFADRRYNNQGGLREAVDRCEVLRRGRVDYRNCGPLGRDHPLQRRDVAGSGHEERAQQ